MKRAGNCSNCTRGIKININKDILCRINGVVSRDFVCSRFQRRVDTWSADERKPKCIECEFFITSRDAPGSSPSIIPENSHGYCQLFTVRYYDGSIKSACSKFCRRAEQSIS
jgi:hypothetical protein